METGDDIDATDPVDRAVELVAHALADVGQRGSDTSGRDLRHRLQTLERLSRMVEAAVIDLTGTCDRSGAYLDDGHVSVRNWVAAETNTSTADALHRARSARLAEACPTVTAELAAGRVGVAAVRELGRVRANQRVGERVDDVIDELLDEAAAQPLHGFVALVREWEALVDADGTHRDHETAHHRRKVRAWRRDDQPGGELWGRLGADQFAEVAEILDRYTEAELATDLDHARATGDDGPLARTPDQRRADAFVQALRDAAASQTPAGGVDPTVNYVVTAGVIDEQITAMIEDRTPVFDTDSLRGQMCLTTNGVPVDPATVVAAMLVGHVRRIVIDSAGRIIDVGHRRRLFTGAARDAALLQAVIDHGDGRCLWPGCGRRRHNQIDHTTERQHGGPTNLANASLLCGEHNRHKSTGYTVWRDAHGVWHVQRPDGTQLGLPLAA
ncbi:MAG: DUF222 domain-containing protein [Desertimonas sp.]